MEVERVLRSPRVRYWKKEGEGSQEKVRMLTLQMPHAALHSSLVAETWFAWQSMPASMIVSGKVYDIRVGRVRTEIHDVVPADSAVLDDDVWRKQDAQ